MWQKKTDDRHENGKKNTVKLVKTWDKNERERERVCVCMCVCQREIEREGGKEMALVFKQKGKAKH